MTKWGCQAVVAQTAFNAVLAIDLLNQGLWQGVGVLDTKAFDPIPFMDRMAQYGFPSLIRDMSKEKVA